MSPRLPVAVSVAALFVACSSSSTSSTSTSTPDASTCYPDNDGINDQPQTVELDVDDSGFLASGPDAGPKSIVSTQNASAITFTLKNVGTKPHGFKVECTSVLPAYPNLPAGCSKEACFPSDSTIAPLMPGQSTTITFLTPIPDGLTYPFNSNEPADANVPGLNSGQWNLM